jgi:hypothetical protein
MMKEPIFQAEKKEPIDPVERYGLETEGEEKSPLFGDRAAAEDFRYPWNKARRAYGALPHLKSAKETLALFRDEAEYFSKHYTTKEPGAPSWRDASYAEGAIMFEAKFGKRLSAFAEEILAHYPPVKDAHKGRELSFFGLSGAGKSTAIEAARELLGKRTVVMDSDTVRFNLLAKMIKEVETSNGAELDEVRQQLIHNNISGALYFLLNHVSKELKDRGYNIIRSSTMPEQNADAVVYLSHPDGIDPREITDEQLPETAKKLFERTQGRVGGPDDYDWEQAETITDFNKMKNVTVQVPEPVHGIFVKNLREALKQPNIRSLKNERIDDPVARKQAYQAQLRPILEALERKS